MFCVATAPFAIGEQGTTSRLLAGVAGLATGVFVLLDIEPAESAVGDATNPQFYLVLFMISTFVAMFFGSGVVLGVSYYRTENLFVPIIGHVIFNGVQVLLRAIEVAA